MAIMYRRHTPRTEDPELMLLNLTEHSTDPHHVQIAEQLRRRILDRRLDSGALLHTRRFARRHRISVRSAERAFEQLRELRLLDNPSNDAADTFVVARIDPAQRRSFADQRRLEAVKERALAARELELAREIQSRLLPPSRLDGRGWTVVARTQPAHFVAGDFYDIIRRTDGSLDVVVADVAGKGIGPGLIMASVKAVLPFLSQDRSPVEVLGALNRRLHRELGRREFVALVLARYRPRSGQLELVNAGMPDPFLIPAVTASRSEDGSGACPAPVALEVCGERLPLGLRSRVSYRSLRTTIEPGERLLLFSDGIAEAETAKGDPLGYEGFARLLEGRSFDLARDGNAPALAPGDQNRELDRRHTDAERWLDDLLQRARAATSPLSTTDDWTSLILERRRACSST